MLQRVWGGPEPAPSHAKGVAAAQLLPPCLPPCHSPARPASPNPAALLTRHVIVRDHLALHHHLPATAGGHVRLRSSAHAPPQSGAAATGRGVHTGRDSGRLGSRGAGEKQEQCSTQQGRSSAGSGRRATRGHPHLRVPVPKVGLLAGSQAQLGLFLLVAPALALLPAAHGQR